MYIYNEIRNSQPASRRSTDSERGAGVVEWLGISALSIGLLVAVFSALEGVGLDLVSMIRGSLGL